jgi:hypothetical protein
MKPSSVISVVIVVFQQVLFVTAQSFRSPLVGESWWVVSVPIWILWLSYFISPWLYNKSGSEGVGYIRDLSTKGWLFVVGAVAWDGCYAAFSHMYGVPIGMR